MRIGSLDFGDCKSVAEIKRVLKALNPDIIFDPAGKLGHYHPNIEKRQGVYLGERHLASMERNDPIPEYDVWAVVKGPDGKQYRSHITMVGWRHTLDRIVRKDVPGVTWDRLCVLLRVNKKARRLEDPMQIEVA